MREDGAMVLPSPEIVINLTGLMRSFTLNENHNEVSNYQDHLLQTHREADRL